MNAAPGWYDAGAPGRVRWWDGTQWTAHEADAPPAAPMTTAAPTPARAAPMVTIASPPGAPAPVGQAHPAAADAPGAGPAPGWYPTPAGSERWWDGRKWTALRTKDGRIGIDWASIEQVGLGWVLGGLFLALGGVQVALAVVSPGLVVAAVPQLLLAALWFAITIQTTLVLRIPRPTTAPVVREEFRPLPGEQEASGAGWYAVSGTLSRWWTGTRWAHYTVARWGIRPTFHAARTRRTLRSITLAFLAVAALAVLAGIVLVAMNAAGAAPAAMAGIGWAVIIGGAGLAVIAVLVAALSLPQVRLLALPTDPPRIEGR